MKRLERLEKDLKKMKTLELEREFDLIQRAKVHLEKELPLREMEISSDDEKRIRGFMFLSQKPILYVVNVNESSSLGVDLEKAGEKYNLTEVASRKNAGATAICGKVEAELADMEEDEAAKAEGAVVESVNPNSPASSAGIRAKDVIVDFDGEHVRSEGPVRRFVYVGIGKHAGDAGSTWDRRMELETARGLRALNPSRLAPGHGKVVDDPGAAMDAAIARGV